jgi:hypothetical protein
MGIFLKNEAINLTIPDVTLFEKIAREPFTAKIIAAIAAMTVAEIEIMTVSKSLVIILGSTARVFSSGMKFENIHPKALGNEAIPSKKLKSVIIFDPKVNSPINMKVTRNR